MVEGVADSFRPESPKEARDILSKVREQEREKWEQTPEEARAELEGLRGVTSETLDNPTHVIPELLQNADDIGGDCSEVTIRLTDDHLIFKNHKEPMTTANVEALGTFTKSTKQGDLDSIGHFGIGFKTTFSVTKFPYIHSGHFSFRYTDDEPTIPEAVDPSEQPLTDTQYFDGTTVTLPFTEDEKANRREILAEQLRSIGSLIPFLNHISTVNVSIYGETEQYERTTIEENLYEITRSGGTENERVKRIRLFAESFRPEDDLLDQLAKEREIDVDSIRELGPTLEVQIAIALDEDGSPVPRDTSHLFCYFPTEPDTQLPFDIQADFSLKPDRKHIVWPDKFNDRLLEHVVSLFETAFVELHAEQESPSRILELVPDPTIERSATPYIDPVVDEITSFVRSEACIPDQQDNLFKPSEVVFLSQPFRSLLTEGEVRELLGQKVRFPSSRISRTARDRIRAIVDDADIDVEELLDACTEASLFQSRTMEWLVRFMAGITQHWNVEYNSKTSGFPSSDVRNARRRLLKILKSMPLIPLENDTSSSVSAESDRIYRLGAAGTEDYHIFADADRLSLVDEELIEFLEEPPEELQSQASSAEDLLFDSSLFGISELNPEDVVRDVINPAFEDGTPKPEQADQFILYIAKRPKTLTEIAEVSLAARTSGADAKEYRPPETLYLPPAYLGTYDSDVIFSPFEQIHSVSPRYLDIGDLSREDWITALTELGVRQRIEVEDQDPWESDRFKTESGIREFLEQHNDPEETEVHSEQYLKGYNGRSDDYRWMKRESRRGSIENFKYALVDRFLPETTRTELTTLARTESDTTKYWCEFLRMLDAGWESYYQDKVYREYHYSRKPGSAYQVKTAECSCPSSFGTFLRELEWVPSGDGSLYHSRDLFVRNELTDDKPVQFIEPEPETQALIEFFKLQRTPGLQVSINTLIQQLRKFPDAPDSDKSEINSEMVVRIIRKQLYAVDEKLPSNPENADIEALDRLHDLAFIYVPDATPAFRTPAEVTWKSPRLGDVLVPISEYYSDFRSLFELLDVQETPQLDDYIRYLEETNLEVDPDPDSQSSTWTEVETAWRRLLANVVYLSQAKLDTGEDRLDEVTGLLDNQSRIPTAQETLGDRDEVQYHSDDALLLSRLPDSITERVLYPWRNGNYTDSIYTVRLARLTDTKPLEPVISRELTTPLTDSDHVGTLGSEYAQILDVAYSYVQTENLLKASEQLTRIAGFTVYRVSEISCRCYLEGEYETTTSDAQSFVDSEQEHIVVTTKDEAAYGLIEVIAQELELPPTDQEKLVSLMKGGLGKSGSLLRGYLNDSAYEFRKLPKSDVSKPEESSEELQRADEATSASPEHETSQPDVESELVETEKHESEPPEPDDAPPETTIDEATDHEQPMVDWKPTPTESSNVRPTKSPTEETTDPGPRPSSDVTTGAQSGKGTTRDDGEQPETNEQGSTSTRKSRPQSERQPRDESASSGTQTNSNGARSRARSGGGPGGGWGNSDANKQKIGDEGEAFVFDQLQTTVKQYFQSEGQLIESVVDNSRTEGTVQGSFDGNEWTVRVADVSSNNCGYDLLLEGASLAPSESELSVTKIGDGEACYVEVKASRDSQSRPITLTSNEYSTAVASPDRYLVVRVYDALSDEPVIPRVFHMIPDIRKQENGVSFSPMNLEIHYSHD